MKKHALVYQPKGSQIYYANYRLYDPDTGELLGQRNKSTGLINKQAAQRWANHCYDKEFRELLTGRNITFGSSRRHGRTTCGDVIDCYQRNCRQVSVGQVVKNFCILIAEGRGQELKPKEREEFVRGVEISDLSSHELEDWREQNLSSGRRKPNNVHAVMRSGKGIFAQAALYYYRNLPGFRGKYPPNIEEWKKVSKPVRAKGDDESFHPIDPQVLADMDKAARKDSPEDSVMLLRSREEAELGHDAEAVRWRNAYAAYWVMRRCGCRNIEVENLRWEWFEVNPSTVHLAVIKRDYWRPKYGGRRLKISEDFYTTLLTVFGPRKEGPEGYVLHGSDRDRYEGCNEFVNKFVRRYLPGRQKGAYELRKQFGSEIAAEYDIATAAYMLGHKGLETAYKHYYTSLKPVRAL